MKQEQPTACTLAVGRADSVRRCRNDRPRTGRPSRVIAMKPFVGRGHVLSRVQELPTEYKLVHAYCLPLRGRLGHVPALHWLFHFHGAFFACGLRGRLRPRQSRTGTTDCVRICFPVLSAACAVGGDMSPPYKGAVFIAEAIDKHHRVYWDVNTPKRRKRVCFKSKT